MLEMQVKDFAEVGLVKYDFSFFSFE